MTRIKKRNRLHRPENIDPAALPRFGHQVAERLTKSWGPLLAFIAFIAMFGIISVQIARSETTIIAITVIVALALISGLVARTYKQL